MVDRQAARSDAGMTRRADQGGSPRRRPEPDVRPVSALHVHRFRRLADDAFSGAVLYACRCGVVRSGF